MLKLNNIVAAGLILAVGAAVAYASDATEFIMKPNQGYVVDAGGRVRIVDFKPDNALLARAQVVPQGAALFMSGDKVMMINDPGVLSSTK